MQKITSHLWYDKEAVEAADFYTTVFPDARVKTTAVLENTPSGSVDVVTFDILGREFQAISAGPMFKFNPSVSFHVICKSAKQADDIWNKLCAGGTVLMELGKYPFSEKYGWLQDKYGLSWQVMYVSDTKVKQKLTPVVMFTKEGSGKAEEAVNFWTSVFPDSRINNVMRYGKGEQPNIEGSVKYASFSLFGEEFGAMDGGQIHSFSFNEAISFVVKCENQEELDYYWNKLSAVPEYEECGWLKDKFGFSWQIVPTIMDEMMADKDKERLARVTQTFLKMKKFDIETLKRSYAGK